MLTSLPVIIIALTGVLIVTVISIINMWYFSLKKESRSSHWEKVLIWLNVPVVIISALLIVYFIALLISTLRQSSVKRSEVYDRTVVAVTAPAGTTVTNPAASSLISTRGSTINAPSVVAKTPLNTGKSLEIGGNKSTSNQENSNLVQSLLEESKRLGKQALAIAKKVPGLKTTTG